MCSTARTARAAPVAATEWGPLELIRARRVVEGETAAIAAGLAKRRDIDAMTRAIERMRELKPRPQPDAARRRPKPSTLTPSSQCLRQRGADRNGAQAYWDSHATGRSSRAWADYFENP
jgi:DNA-binding FadR family transcriptional regulator